MLFQKNSIGVFLLLIIVVVFACIGNINEIAYYNFQAKEGFDDNVPKCGGSDAPDCYATQNSEKDIFDYKDKYMLKTKMVPPVLTGCPDFVSSHNHENGLTGKEIGVSGEELDEVLSKLEVSNTEVNSNETSTSSNSVTNNTTINNTRENEGARKPVVPANTENSDKFSKCPPCPACERCPEPAFTCEKVINYRSPAAGEYLPIPVLNDFSSFPSS